MACQNNKEKKKNVYIFKSHATIFLPNDDVHETKPTTNKEMKQRNGNKRNTKQKKPQNVKGALSSAGISIEDSV